MHETAAFDVVLICAAITLHDGIASLQGLDCCGLSSAASTDHLLQNAVGLTVDGGVNPQQSGEI
jgi:hypothetical protein